MVPMISFGLPVLCHTSFPPPPHGAYWPGIRRRSPACPASAKKRPVPYCGSNRGSPCPKWGLRCGICRVNFCVSACFQLSWRSAHVLKLAAAAFPVERAGLGVSPVCLPAGLLFFRRRFSALFFVYPQAAECLLTVFLVNAISLNPCSAVNKAGFFSCIVPLPARIVQPCPFPFPVLAEKASRLFLAGRLKCAISGCCQAGRPCGPLRVFTTSPLRASRPNRLGMTIRPLNRSDKFQTRSTCWADPTMTKRDDQQRVNLDGLLAE